MSKIKIEQKGPADHIIINDVRMNETFVYFEVTQYYRGRENIVFLRLDAVPQLIEHLQKFLPDAKETD